MDHLPKAVPVHPQSPTLTSRQMNMVFDNTELQALNAAQRATAIAQLASLLIQAAGVATQKERDDDER